MQHVLVPSDFGPDFQKNAEKLAVALGCAHEKQSRKVFVIRGPIETYVPTVAGKHVSAALLEYLRQVEGGKVRFTIEPGLHDLIRAFYAPLWDEPRGKHPTIDALREPGVAVTLLANGDMLPEQIADLFERRATLDHDRTQTAKEAVNQLFTLLEHGAVRSIEPSADAETGWAVQEYVKQGILLWFALHDNELICAGEHVVGWDKVPLLWEGWEANEFRSRGFRVMPGAIARRGAHVAQKVILMAHGTVNVGAYVGEGTMVDTGATVGSCASIGKGVHLSGGAGIGGVLEPIQASPTVIEDGAFIGARSEVAEGVIVRTRAVLSMGVFIGKNTPIVDRAKPKVKGKYLVYRGSVPESAVVMNGIYPENGLICPTIVKYRDGKTDAATALNDVLRS